MDSYGLWIMEQALSGLIVFFPVTIALLIGVGIAIQRLLRGERFDACLFVASFSSILGRVAVHSFA